MFTTKGLAPLLFILMASLAATFANAKPYKCAEIYSKQTYKYGRYEMRMKVAKGSGVLSNFFTYKNGSQIGNTFWEEIDIEVFGKNNATQWQSNVIIGTSRPTTKTEGVHTAPVSLGDDYHTYVLEWTPDYVAWFVDGSEVRRIPGGQFVTGLTSPQDMRFSIWAANIASWVGNWDPNILPVYQFVNYLDYKPYNASTNTFVAGWRDDFNTFDTNRWAKADWEHGDSYADYHPANVVVKDGTLVLALTHYYATGFNGAVPVDKGDIDIVTTGTLIQAENSANKSGTEVERTNDTDGGSNVGWINTGNWLVYPVNIPTAGNYIVSYRVASLNGGGVIQLEKAGGNPIYGTVNVPGTGGWQTWVTMTHVVSLPAGIQDIGIVAKSGGFNLNWFKIDPVDPLPKLIINSNFNNGMANWTVNSGNGAGATSGVQNGTAYVWIATGGTNIWDVQLSHNMTIAQGKRYKVDFDARITEGSTRTLKVNIEKNIAPWTNYGTTTFTLGTSWKHFTYTYDAVTASDAQARLLFQLGVNTSDVNVDNITLTEL
ncbi:MAG: carbohydrate-binding protein [Pseudomonadota bacterium]